MMSGLAAMLVLFTTMIDPRVSSFLAIVLLIGYTIYFYTRSPKRKTGK